MGFAKRSLGIGRKPSFYSHVGISFHTYNMYGRHEIKHTYWYRMKTSSKERLLPQTEEGIRELRWIKQEDLGEVLKQSYPNIRNIFSM